MQHSPTVEIKLAAGAVVDLATREDVTALQGPLDSLLGAAPPPAYFVRRPGAATPVSSTLPTFIDLGGPVDGTQWELKMVVVLWAPNGAFGAAIAQPVAILVSGTVPNNLGAVDVADLGLATPVNFLYGTDQNMAQAPEHVYVGVLATAAQVTAGATGGQFVAVLRAVQTKQRSQGDIETSLH